MEGSVSDQKRHAFFAPNDFLGSGTVARTTKKAAGMVSSHDFCFGNKDRVEPIIHHALVRARESQARHRGHTFYKQGETNRSTTGWAGHPACTRPTGVQTFSQGDSNGNTGEANSRRLPHHHALSRRRWRREDHPLHEGGFWRPTPV